MFGLTNASLTSGAVGTLPARSTPQDIFAYLESIKSALDVDGNGSLDALTDGVLLIRYMSGIRKPALAAGGLGVGATRTESDIETYILSLMP